MVVPRVRVSEGGQVCWNLKSVGFTVNPSDRSTHRGPDSARLCSVDEVEDTLVGV